MTKRHGALDPFIIACLASGKYEVDDAGRVWNCRWYGTSQRQLVTTCLNAHGYVRCGLTLPPERIRLVMVHRVVAIAVHGPPSDQAMEVDHLDGNKQNNAPANLEWVLRPENQLRAYRTGLRECPDHIGHTGSRHYLAKLTEDQARSVHRLIAEGHTQASIAEQFGMTQGAISLLSRGINWPDIYRECHPE